ncbi:MAG TPA: PQQ-dependent sugar dehydrogenase [Acidimicrobiales bacterium]|nr:PQQ-dependent sugar dehydrogenase [Acidimicrobiales bacterium]
MIRRTLLALSVVAGSVLVPSPPAGAAVPDGFTDTLVASVGGPTGLAFTPDGRMLVTTQGGRLRIVENNALVATPALDLTGRICSNSERGLLGVAVDPEFATNRFVYLYYTHNLFGACVNRVSRWILGDDNVASGEVILVDRIHSTAGNHNGGDLNFGKDGYLYVSVGDGGCDYASPSNCAGNNDAARDRHVLLGKILRITRQPGVLPPDNPFLGAGTGACATTGSTTAGNWCQEIYATGLRNPFRFAFDPNAAGTRFYVNDVGQAAWEEIDLGAPGADYGWNVREGHCARGSTTDCGPPPTGMTNPIFAYGRSDGCGSITGGAFSPAGVWPAPYDQRYFFADYVCGRIFVLNPNPQGGFTRGDFVTGLGGGSAVHLRFGPWAGTQALYYTSYAGGGQIRRIAYTATPTIAGSTWYSDGTNAKTPTGGTVIRAYATNALENVPYKLVIGTAGCASVVAVLNETSVFAGSNGLLGRVTGTVPAGLPPGAYTVCFRNITGPATATGVVRLELTAP